MSGNGNTPNAPIIDQGDSVKIGPPFSPGKFTIAQDDLKIQPPDTSASQKVQIEYLRKMVSALVVSFHTYKYDTEKRIQAMTEPVIEPDSENSLIKVKTDCEKEIADLRNQLNTDIGHLVTRCEKIEQRLDKLEERNHFDCEQTIIAQNVPDSPGKDIIDLAKDLIYQGTNTHDVMVVRAKRLTGYNNKPGLLKIELQSLTEKIKVLRNKQKLKDHHSYNRVYIRSSKTHAERMMESNLTVLLQQLPYGNQYRIAGNGRLVPADYSQDPRTPDNRSHPLPNDRNNFARPQFPNTEIPNRYPPPTTRFPDPTQYGPRWPAPNFPRPHFEHSNFSSSPRYSSAHPEART